MTLVCRGRDVGWADRIDLTQKTLCVGVAGNGGGWVSVAGSEKTQAVWVCSHSGGPPHDRTRGTPPRVFLLASRTAKEIGGGGGTHGRGGGDAFWPTDKSCDQQPRQGTPAPIAPRCTTLDHPHVRARPKGRVVCAVWKALGGGRGIAVVATVATSHTLDLAFLSFFFGFT